MNNTLTNTIDDLFAVSGYLMEIALRVDPDISNFTPVFEALGTPVEQLSFKIGEWMVAGEAPRVQEWFKRYDGNVVQYLSTYFRACFQSKS